MTASFLYNEAAKRLTNNEINFGTLKVMLVNGATFTASEIDVATTLTGFEVSGNGWPIGGADLTGVNIAVINTDDARLDADNVGITATGGDIGPATAGVIYDSTDGFPIMYIDFETAVTAADGTPFSFFWNSSGIIQFRYG